MAKKINYIKQLKMLTLVCCIAIIALFVFIFPFTFIILPFYFELTDSLFLRLTTIVMLSPLLYYNKEVNVFPFIVKVFFIFFIFFTLINNSRSTIFASWIFFVLFLLIIHEVINYVVTKIRFKHNILTEDIFSLFFLKYNKSYSKLFKKTYHINVDGLTNVKNSLTKNSENISNNYFYLVYLMFFNIIIHLFLFKKENKNFTSFIKEAIKNLLNINYFLNNNNSARISAVFILLLFFTRRIYLHLAFFYEYFIFDPLINLYLCTGKFLIIVLFFYIFLIIILRKLKKLRFSDSFWLFVTVVLIEIFIFKSVTHDLITRPTITGIKIFGQTWKQMTIYGNNFGVAQYNDAKIFLNEEEPRVLSWENKKVIITIEPATSLKGDVWLKNVDQKISNTYNLNSL